MNSLLQRAPGFWVPYFLLLIAGLTLQAGIGNDQITLSINAVSNTGLDLAAEAFTLLGDGKTTLVLFVILLFVGVGKAVSALAITNLCGLVVQLMKRQLYAGLVRPAVVFAKHLPALHFVPGVRIYYLETFPSGHTTTAFSMFLLLAMYTSKRWLQGLYLLIAVGVGWSRVYLAEHFFSDVLAASVLGSVVTVIIVYFVDRSGLPGKKWFSVSLANRLSFKH